MGCSGIKKYKVAAAPSQDRCHARTAVDCGAGVGDLDVASSPPRGSPPSPESPVPKRISGGGGGGDLPQGASLAALRGSLRSPESSAPKGTSVGSGRGGSDPSQGNSPSAPRGSPRSAEPLALKSSGRGLGGSDLPQGTSPTWSPESPAPRRSGRCGRSSVQLQGTSPSAPKGSSWSPEPRARRGSGRGEGGSHLLQGLRSAADAHSLDAAVVVLETTPQGVGAAAQAAEEQFDTGSASLLFQTDAALALLAACEDVSSHDEMEDRSASAQQCLFPAVEVSLATRKVLLQWHRWSQNSLRIAQEEKLKALQHVRHPRSQYREPSPALSPQPSPRFETPRRSLPQKAEASVPPHAQPVSVLRARARVSAEPQESLFRALKGDQRQSMDEQGVKLKLVSFLGDEAAKARSFGTPGFGVETPSFLGAVSRGSSAVASVMSSGVSSPVGTGQMSPWLLEAEALLSDIDDSTIDLHHVAAAWGAPPDYLHSPTTFTSGKPEHCKELGNDFAAEFASLGGILETIWDGDELEQVSIFASLPTVAAEKTIDASDLKRKPSDSIPWGDLKQSALTPFMAVDEDQPSKVCGELPATSSSSAPFAPIERPKPNFAVGDIVKYWSASRNQWLPARVLETRPRGVFVVDKQLKGCLAKVKVSELIAEADEREDYGLRAFKAFGEDTSQRTCDDSPQRCSDTWVTEESLVATEPRVRRPPTRRPPEGSKAEARDSPRTAMLRNRTLPRSATPPRLRGRIIRDDFSDDSD